MRVSNRIVNLLYESSTKDDKIWKLIDKYEAGEMSKEEVEKEVKRLNKGNKAEIEADLALIFKESVEESTGDPAIDNDPDLNPEEVQSEVDYWTDVDNSRTEDVSGREPVGVYTVSNTQAIYVYDIKYDIDDMVLAGDSSDPTKAKWRFINYEDLTDEETGEAIPFFYYNAIKVPMNEVMRTNI